ncbi:C-terminal binding protein [Roseiconus nitratireducens]|uniref:C-terminal binding protein n=1 Tax=Roseiconus nitratireducens TaxID=2605748 RepID=A0A5M6DIF4_9BACT|nr:C-terminal binding protein [Roseiconus nitratireducens]KAA5546156.1 C-terminal binding protein [Roseiconus nitratireducens]
MTSPRFKVVITDLITEPLEYERSVLDGVADVVALQAMSESELQGKVEDADAVMVYHYFRFTDATIKRLERCRVIVRPGVGYDGVDIEAARLQGIPVCNVPDYGTEEVADSAVSMAISLARGSHFLNSRLKRGVGDWNVDQAAPLWRLRGRRFGIIGCGRIGTAAALRAKSFGMDVAFYDPYLPDGIDKALGVERFDRLEELLSASHILSLHCPLTAETRGMIGGPQIREMPWGSILVNTSRGGVVDTAAVIAALGEGHLAGAAIDVLEQEPPEPDSPVLAAWRDPTHPAHDRLLLNPHTAFYCEEGCAEFRTKGAQEVLRGLLGEPLRNCVNAPVNTRR